MRRFLLLLILLIAGSVLLVNGIKAKVKHDLTQPLATVSNAPSPPSKDSKRIPANGTDTTSLFVPYWTIQDSDLINTDYNEYLYFGVTPTTSGINTDEAGYAQLEQFSANVPQGKKKLLVLRMLDSENNTKILKSKAIQKRVIADTLSTAKTYGYDGVVLDLELSAIPFESLISQIREFNSLFYAETKAQRMSYGIAIYGDTFYRLRPFDVKAIGQKTDKMYVMAYDFHKSRGNPGPNFPLQGEDMYGYDMTVMSEDFLKFVSPQKVSMIFGLFGYDWTVDKNGTAIEYGKAKTVNEITNTFLSGCTYDQCVIKRDKLSSETQINYVDEENQRHTIWFEDMESVKAKEEYLRGKGITSFSFWAHSYF